MDLVPYPSTSGRGTRHNIVQLLLSFFPQNFPTFCRKTDSPLQVTASNFDFLANDFDGLTLVNSSAWKQESLKTPVKFRITQNTLVNSSIMRWSDQRHVFEKFIKHRDLYVRLYSGIDRYIYNESVKYNYFMGDQISSWQEGVKHNTIVLHNQKYV